MIVAGSSVVKHFETRLSANIGKTISPYHPSLQRSGDDAAMAEVVEKLHRGEITRW